MITIDLTPLEYRAFRFGKRRVVALRRAFAVVFVFLATCMMWLHIYSNEYENTALLHLRSEVVELEQRVQQYASSKDAAQRALMQQDTVDAKRQLVLSILDVVSSEVPAYLSLSKITISLDEVILEGAAQDARALSEFLERVAHRCPRVHHLVHKMHTTVTAKQSLESFSIRLRLSVEQYGSRWCREGGSHAG